MERTIMFTVQEIKNILPQFQFDNDIQNRELSYIMTLFYLLNTTQQVQTLRHVLQLENGKLFVQYVLHHSEYRLNFSYFMEDSLLFETFNQDKKYA